MFLTKDQRSQLRKAASITWRCSKDKTHRIAVETSDRTTGWTDVYCYDCEERARAERLLRPDRVSAGTDAKAASGCASCKDRRKRKAASMKRWRAKKRRAEAKGAK